MKAKRLDQIFDYIRQQHSVSLKQLCEVFGVSMNTIRRDINILLQNGKIEKVYGGVIYKDSHPIDTLVSYEERHIKNPEKKKKIGKKAAAYVSDGDTIFLDSGTTTIHMIPYLQEKKGLTLITYSLPNLAALMAYPQIQVISLPGQLLAGTSSFVGNATSDYLSHFNINKAFMACTGISLKNQITNATFEEYPIKEMALQQSQTIYLLADSKKFGHAGVMTYAPILRMDAIITDKLPDSQYTEYFKEHGVALDIV